MNASNPGWTRRAFLARSAGGLGALEKSAAVEFLAEQSRRRGEEGAWADFCQSLYALNAFLYLE